MSAPPSRLSEDVPTALWYENSYECSECGTVWTDEWSCMCNDRCPECDSETEPASSDDRSRGLTEEDYIGAARLVSDVLGVTILTVTDEHAKAYAEALLEGGEHRFNPLPSN